MLQPVYTMSRFNWFNVRGTEGVGFIRTLRTLLTNNLPNILPQLSTINAVQLATVLEGLPVVNGEYGNNLVLCFEANCVSGSVQCQIYPAIVDMVVLSNSVSFFGAELGELKSFSQITAM
jgi:hypothetical protein